MKTRSIFVTLLILSVTLVSCSCGQASRYAGGQTACDHAYLPLRPGAHWEYWPPAGGAEDLNGTIAEVTCSELACTACVRGDTGDEIDREGTHTGGCDGFGYYGVPEFRCDDDGIYKADRFGQYWLYLPSVEKLTPGYSWGGSNESIAPFQSYTRTYRVTGLEPVSVQGQEYEGLQVERTSAFHQQARYITVSHVWQRERTRLDVDVLTFARGVGLVQVVRSYTECVYIEGATSKGNACNPDNCSFSLCEFFHGTSTTNLAAFSIPP